MPPRFHILSHIEPQAIRSISDSHPRLQHLTNVLVERHGLSGERARHFVERLLTHVLDDFGETYSREMSARIDRIVQLRDRVTGIYESAINGHGLPEGVTPTSVEGMFRDLQHEMDSLQSPTRRAHEDAPLIRDDVASERLSTLSNEPAGIVSTPDVVGRRTTPEGLQTQRETFRQLDANTQRIISDASELAPDLVHRVIHAENSSSRASSLQELTDVMHRDGMTESDIARMTQGLENMNQAHRTAQRGSGTLEATLREAALQNIVAQVNDSRFQTEVTRASTFFSRLAHENPEMLQHLWQQYQQSGSTRTFRQYVVARMRTHIRGMAGEFTSAFELGNGLSLLKGPDYDVTIPGTDLVGVATLTGDVWLIDNKAVSGSELTAVNALTRNLVGNIADDARDFASLTSRADTPPHIVDAVRRLEQTSHDIQSYTHGMTPDQVNSIEVQQEIARICNRHRIRRVVTNAGGEIQGLSDGLRRRGIELEDLNH